MKPISKLKILEAKVTSQLRIQITHISDQDYNFIIKYINKQ